jgi:hypothetical protein
VKKATVNKKSIGRELYRNNTCLDNLGIVTVEFEYTVNRKEYKEIFQVYPYKASVIKLYSEDSQCVIYQIDTEQSFQKGGTDKHSLSVPHCVKFTFCEHLEYDKYK